MTNTKISPKGERECTYNLEDKKDLKNLSQCKKKE